METIPHQGALDPASRREEHATRLPTGWLPRGYHQKDAYRARAEIMKEATVTIARIAGRGSGQAAARDVEISPRRCQGGFQPASCHAGCHRRGGNRALDAASRRSRRKSGWARDLSGVSPRRRKRLNADALNADLNAKQASERVVVEAAAARSGGSVRRRVRRRPRAR
jgi:hypothetical protein